MLILLLVQEMGKIKVALFAMIAGICFPCCGASMDYFNRAVYDNGFHVYRDTYFASDEVLNDDVYIDGSSVRLENNGRIMGNIYVDDGCDFYIQNKGMIFRRIYVGDFANVTQIIKGSDDVSFLNIDVPYVVSVDGARDVNFIDLVRLGQNAGTLVVNNSSIVLSKLDAALYDIGRDWQTTFRGVITLSVQDGFSLTDDVLLIRNVDNKAKFVVDGTSPDRLYSFMAYVENNELHLGAVRETDYFKILRDNRGLVLNAIRDARPDDALLVRLDSARTIGEINSIMSHSIAFNPSLLGRPIRILNKFMTDGVIANDVPGDIGTSGQILYVMADDFDIYGGRADLAVSGADGFSAGVSLYGAFAESDDEINAFSGNMFGGAVYARYQPSVLMLRGMIGGTNGKFEVPYLFDGENMRDNARGVSGYGFVDAGLTLGAITPYIGAESHFEKVLDTKNSETAIRAGVDSKFVRTMDSGQYEYKITMGLNSAGLYNAGIAIGYFSTADAAGGGAAINFMHDEYGLATMFSLYVKMLF